MEGRRQWRATLPQKYADFVRLAQIMTLFLIHVEPERGLYIFTDPLDNQYTVNIGYKDHCIHTLYVMLRVLKLAPDNPLVWQKHYTHEEMSRLLAQPEQRRRVLERPHSQHPSRQKTNKDAVGEQQQEQAPIENDAICSICHQCLLNGTALTRCRASCQNSYHIECVRIWTNHKRLSNSQLSCPMCRCSWSEAFLVSMKQDEARYLKQHSFGRLCHACKKDIPLRLYKCLFCKQVELCEKCYKGWKHAQHDRWMLKLHSTKKWSVAETRSSFDAASYKDVMEVLKNHSSQQPSVDELARSLQVALNKEKQPPTANTLEYLVCCFPSVEKEIYKLYKKIDFGEGDIKCIMCRRTNITDMRRLYCKHFIDEKCLEHLLNFKIMCCPLDNSTMLHGYSEIVEDEKAQCAQKSETQAVERSLTQKQSSGQEQQKKSKESTTKKTTVEPEPSFSVLRGRGTSLAPSKKKQQQTNFQDLVIDTRIKRKS